MAQRREMMNMGATLMMLSATVIWQERNHSALEHGEAERTRAPPLSFPRPRRQRLRLNDPSGRLSISRLRSSNDLSRDKSR
jgi:hypothetical protein